MDFKDYFEKKVDLSEVQEIRLRADKPLCIIKRGKAYFLAENGKITTIENGYIVSKSEVEVCFLKLCKYSVHAYKSELREGFITTEQGHRVGIGGNFRNSGITVDSVTSMNIRLAREYPSCGRNIVKRFYSKGTGSLIIAGEPSSGKTTLIRDLAVLLTNDSFSKPRKICIVDSRNEICGYNRGHYTFNVGDNTDIITGLNKSEGIMQAIRVLSPEIIICDEISGISDSKAVRDCLNSGVELITTVHAANKNDMLSKPQIKLLIDSGAFKYVALLKGKESPSEVKEYGEVRYENNRDNFNINHYFIDWDR